MNLEQRISMAHYELDAFGLRGPHFEAPAAATVSSMQSECSAVTRALVSCRTIQQLWNSA
jgi:hypothetical protein